MRWRRWLDSAAAISVIVASASVVWLIVSIHFSEPARQPRPQRPAGVTLPQEPVPLDQAAIKGRPGVRAGVIEYSDFECPFCGTFARETLPKIMAEYVNTGKAFIAFRHLPLDTIHPSSVRAAEAAECARRQGRFWEIHNTLFETPRGMLSRTLQQAPKTRGLDLDSRSFDACLEGSASAAVGRDIAAARALGITGTPTFLFGVLNEHGNLQVTRREAGAIPFGTFAAILDEIVANAK